VSRKRTRYDNKFKVKLVLEVLKGEKTLNPCALVKVKVLIKLILIKELHKMLNSLKKFQFLS